MDEVVTNQTMLPLILLIEDDKQIRKYLHTILEGSNYLLAEAESAREGIVHATMKRPDCIILDLGLPDRDGIEIIKEIRSWSHVPIIVLSAREGDLDKVHALDSGADDYLLKPFSPDELLARIRVNLRRALRNKSEEESIEVKDLRLNRVARIITMSDVELKLTPTEYRLLSYLMEHAGKVVTHTQLLKEVWGTPFQKEVHYLRTYMTQLRKKIEVDPSRPQYIFTEPGIGYRIKG